MTAHGFEMLSGRVSPVLEAGALALEAIRQTETEDHHDANPEAQAAPAGEKRD